MSADTMTCMMCATTKAWPDGFPNRMDARCWDCAWKAYLREKHPRVVRKARREAEKRARVKFRNEAHREVEAVTEKMLVESGAMTLGAFEVLILAEAEKRKLLITTTRDVASGGIRVSWHPERVGEGEQ